MDYKNKDIKIIKEQFGKNALILKYIQNWAYIKGKNNNNSAVLIINPDIKERNAAFFGFINFDNDLEESTNLFKKIENVAKKYSCSKLVGPINYSTWFDYRWMTFGFKNTKIQPEPTNPEYMPALAKKNGYSEFLNYLSTSTIANDSKINKYKEKYEKLLSDEYDFRRYKGFKIAAVLKYIYEISSDAFTQNPLFSPISYKMFKKFYISKVSKSKKIQPIVDICYKDKEPVGFLYTYKNPYDTDMYVWKTIAIKRKYQKNNIGSAFRYIAHKSALDSNCSKVIYHLTYEKNVVRKFLNEGNIIKKYSLFSKDI